MTNSGQTGNVGVDRRRKARNLDKSGGSSMTSRITAMLCATAAAATAAAAVIMPAPAGADDTVKIAYIDPLSAAARHRRARLKDASIPRRGRSTPRAACWARSSRWSPTTTSSARRKASCRCRRRSTPGIRYITQGNGSAVAARHHRLRRQVQRAQSRQGSAVSSTTRRSIRSSPTRSAASGISASTPTAT